MNRDHFLKEFNSLEHIGQHPEELWEVVQHLQGRNVRSMIEIGVSRGGSMWIWNMVLGGGPIIGIDNEDRITSSKEPIFWEFPSNITYLVGDSHSQEMIERVGNVIGAFGQVDFLWIDGDHSTEGCKADYENYTRFVKDGGLVGIHDYNMPDVKAFVGTLPTKKIINYGLGTALVKA